ncbi:MAG TPA: lipocalin-like domain-containing protein [Syntrophorhabdales bacterium]|nr:lipocalin-like domain-containing protein [Syntrophorhabdales bacterium]
MTSINHRLKAQGARRKAATLLAAAVLLAVPSLVLTESAVTDADWKQAIGPWQWAFPRDHGSHPQFRTEWWYFTGNLADATGKRYGYQVTFFRQAVLKHPEDPQNAWSLRDLYLAHFTLTDAAAGRFSYDERVSRSGPGLAGAAQDRMQVWLLSWSATMENNTIHIQARNDQMSLALDLAPRKSVVLHGEHGLSRKGPRGGQASYYYSFTDLETVGTLKTPGSPHTLPVKGTSWFDHEFGSNQLAGDQVGWDWFSIHLSDRRDLMIYLLRRKDGTVEPSSSGTLVDHSGRVTHLRLGDIQMEVLDRWKSQKSEAVYPSHWRISIPSQRIEVSVKPLVADQELLTEGSTGIIYWEGTVIGTGTSGGKEVSCEGYIEMTGYAKSIGGIF